MHQMMNVVRTLRWDQKPGRSSKLLTSLLIASFVRCQPPQKSQAGEPQLAQNFPPSAKLLLKNLTTVLMFSIILASKSTTTTATGISSAQASR